MKKIFIMLLALFIILLGIGIAVAPAMTPGVQIASASPVFAAVTPKQSAAIDLLAVLGIAACAAFYLITTRRKSFNTSDMNRQKPTEGANTTRRPGLLRA